MGEVPDLFLSSEDFDILMVIAMGTNTTLSVV